MRARAHLVCGMQSTGRWYYPSWTTPTVVEKDWVGIGSDAGTIPRPVLPNGAEYEGAIVWKRWRQLCLRAGCGRQHWSPVFANEPTTAFGGGLEHMRECPAGTPEGPVCDCVRKPACPGRKQLVLGHKSTLTVLDWAQYAAAWHGRTLKWTSGTEECGRPCPPRIVCHAVAVTLHTHTPGAYRSCACTTCVCCARGAAIRRSRSVASGCPSALMEDRLAFQKPACLRGTCTPLQ